MLRYIVLLFMFFSFYSDAGQYRLSQNASFSSMILVPAGTLCGSNIEECLGALPATVNSSVTGGNDFNKSNQSGVSVSGNVSTVTVYYRKYNNYAAVVSVVFRASFVDDGLVCSDREECFFYANNICQGESKLLTDFQYIGTPQADNFTHSCSDTPKEPAEQCRDKIIQQCSNNLDMASSNYTDNGDGTTSCTGTCNDGTAAQEQCIPSLANNYCDVKDAPSDLDFGSGGSGSDVGSPSNTTTDPDTENDIDYEPDGSSSDSSTDMSSLQGDKLINEVVKSRNDNTENLASTTDTTNRTIVEKTDDIQRTISESANGIIDAVNNASPFYDGNIVDAINGIGSGGFDDSGIVDAVNGLGTGIDGLGDKIDGLGDELGGTYQSDFGVAEFSAYDTMFIGDETLTGLTNGLKASIGVENRLFINEVREKFNFTAGNSGGYQANNLDLGKWGSHDISLARFSEYFGGVGNVVYFLAALSALTIVLGGIKS